VRFLSLGKNELDFPLREEESLHSLYFWEYDAFHIRHVYLDLDKEGNEALDAIRNSPDVPTPNFVLDSSPGKHQVVWKVSGFSQDEAETLLHSLAKKFSGDLAATDSTRVLRLPGFANRKLSEEFVVRARQESNAVYTLRDFTIDEDSPEAPRHFGEYQQRHRTPLSDHKSQSERDWAYAKRALARGDNPTRQQIDHRFHGWESHPLRHLLFAYNAARTRKRLPLSFPFSIVFQLGGASLCVSAARSAC